jgi:ABC-type transport system substrate-binding protein
MQRRAFLAAGAASAAALAAPSIVRAATSKLLKFVPQSDVTILDPIWTTAYATRNHGFMIFDTLYGIDGTYAAKPQMVSGHTTSADARQWDLTLRDGLLWHDGEKVLARDCVASIKRWGARDPFGQTLIAYADELSAPDDKTIRFRLKKALRPAARCAWQTRQQFLCDDAGAPREHRSVQSGKRDGGLGPIQVGCQRARGRFACGLRTQRRLQASRR